MSIHKVIKAMFETEDEMIQYAPRTKEEQDYFDGLYEALKNSCMPGNEFVAGAVATLNDKDIMFVAHAGKADDVLTLIMGALLRNFITTYCAEFKHHKTREMLRTLIERYVDSALDEIKDPEDD